MSMAVQTRFVLFQTHIRATRFHDDSKRGNSLALTDLEMMLSLVGGKAYQKACYTIRENEIEFAEKAKIFKRENSNFIVINTFCVLIIFN